MSERVRVGVIGTSPFADFWHLRHLGTHPGAEVVAICGRNQERAQEVAAKHGIPRVFADYREMIEKGELDAVVVATPDDLHYPMTMDALEAGLHVLCEKPLAMTAGQAKEMYDKAEAAGVKHMTDFTYRWFPLHRHVKALVDDGYAGNPMACSIRYLGGHYRDPAYLWRFDRQRALGALGDIGSHMIDLARWYVGDVARVSATLGSFIQRLGPEGQPCESANDTASLLLEFECGAQGIIQLSQVAMIGQRIMEQQILLHGHSGTLEGAYVHSEGMEIRGVREGQQDFVDLPVQDELWGGADMSKPLMQRLLHVFGTQSVADRLFIDAILEDTPIAPSFYEGWKAQQVIDAAISSHREGRWVAV